MIPRVAGAVSVTGSAIWCAKTSHRSKQKREPVQVDCRRDDFRQTSAESVNTLSDTDDFTFTTQRRLEDLHSNASLYRVTFRVSFP